MKRNGLKLRITLSDGHRQPMYEKELNDVDVPKNLRKGDVEGLMDNAINTIKMTLPSISQNKKVK